MGINPEIVTEASDKFYKIIKHPRAHGRRLHFIEKCVENLGESKSVAESLGLLSKIMGIRYRCMYVFMY